MTETEVANLALARIGNWRISSLTESSVEAGQCARHFAVTRRMLLRDFDWNFAVSWALLSQIADGEAFDYDYAYALPSDYLRAIAFNGVPVGNKQSTSKIAGNVLYSDESDADNAKLEYIRDVTDVTEWDDVFATAFSWYLAAAIAPSIKQSPELSGHLLSAGKAFLAEAKGSDTQETGLKVIRGVEYSRYQAARDGHYPDNPNFLLQNWGPPN